MEVTVYQPPEGVPCYKCEGTKRALKNANIPYDAVHADDAIIDKYKAEGHTSFPIVVASFGDSVTWTWSDLRLDHVKELAKLAT